MASRTMFTASHSTVEFRGRRHYQVQDEIHRWNYLMHHDNSSSISEVRRATCRIHFENVTVRVSLPRPRASGRRSSSKDSTDARLIRSGPTRRWTRARSSRYETVGVWERRRLPDKCWLQERLKKLERVEERRKVLQEMNKRKGNPITDLPRPRPEGKKMFPSTPTPEQVQETLNRNRTSIYRFAISDRKKKLHENRNVKQSASVIGFGRRDIPSRGVLDNFTGHGYAKRATNPSIHP